MVTIALSDVGVSLGRRPVVHDVNAVLAPGAVVGIVGPNGAGKSTLLRATLGLVASTGSICVDDVPLARMARGVAARTLAYLPQGQTLHWPLTVERLVTLGRLPHLAPMSRLSDADAAAVERALERAGVADLRERIATDLSGGERARVLLARALAVEAPGLLADEPLASLDPGHQIDVMDLLRAEARGGALVVTVLHDLTMAARYCDRVLLMDAGTIVADGVPLDVLTPERLRAVYGITATIERFGETVTIVPTGRAY
ncbi:ABC transporter [Sphingomonas panacis]|uniref:ABC transporter n=1 Tax=Sphingomonas panacis TaxID=1560345 RepID=A0A1B3ZBJ8_9SPHN|nr:ABC transporter ATP-binding protein [Sphingomonas panacis]AOH84779.1 ABC transporter [Sphingomonas panacis]